MRLLLFIAPALVIVTLAVQLAWVAGRNANPTTAELPHSALRAEMVTR